MQCPSCGEENPETAVSCTMCGVRLQAAPAPPPPPPAPAGDVTLGGLIPARNPNALIAYYLGIFSLLPFLGAPMGIIALILGLKGLRQAHRNPEIKGATHAWVGIICGGFWGVVYTLLTISMIAAILSQEHR